MRAQGGFMPTVPVYRIRPETASRSRSRKACAEREPDEAPDQLVRLVVAVERLAAHSL